jgi:hypothetical protein
LYSRIPFFYWNGRQGDVDESSVVRPTDRRKIDAVVIRIARLIGRQLAREAFQAQSAANDNRQDGE